MDLDLRRAFLTLCITQAAGVENVCSHAQFLGGFEGDGQRIAGHHLDLYAHLLRSRDSRLGIVARRIEQGQHALELPFAIRIGARHAQRTKAPCGEFVDRLVDGGLDLSGIGRQFQNHLRRALRDLEFLSIRALDGSLGALVHGIEGLEMSHLIGLQGLIVLQTAQHGQVDRVLVVRARGQRRVENDLIGRERCSH